MYSAKALGRNQVYVFEEPDEDARIPRAPISPEGRARAVEVGRLARSAAEQALIQTLAPYPNHRGQPSARIATLAVLLGRRLGLPDAELDRLRLAALLHDVGKLALPEEILEKPSALTSQEWQAVVQHPRIGQVILEQAVGAQGRRADRAPPPRALRRPRLPLRPARPGDPARAPGSWPSPTPTTR